MSEFVFDIKQSFFYVLLYCLMMAFHKSQNI